jgi:hypothetical protein
MEGRPIRRFRNDKTNRLMIAWFVVGKSDGFKVSR